MFRLNSLRLPVLLFPLDLQCLLHEPVYLPLLESPKSTPCPPLLYPDVENAVLGQVTCYHIEYQRWKVEAYKSEEFLAVRTEAVTQSFDPRTSWYS